HLKSRYTSCEVLAQDRDLLDTAFLRRNGRRLRLDVAVCETLLPADGLLPESFPLVVGELSASAGPSVAARELGDGARLLAPGGEALILASEKQEREWLPRAAPKNAALTLLLRREGAFLLRSWSRRIRRCRPAKGKIRSFPREKSLDGADPVLSECAGFSRAYR